MADRQTPLSRTSLSTTTTTTDDHLADNVRLDRSRGGECLSPRHKHLTNISVSLSLTSRRPSQHLRRAAGQPSSSSESSFSISFVHSTRHHAWFVSVSTLTIVLYSGICSSPRNHNSTVNTAIQPSFVLRVPPSSSTKSTLSIHISCIRKYLYTNDITGITSFSILESRLSQVICHPSPHRLLFFPRFPSPNFLVCSQVHYLVIFRNSQCSLICRSVLASVLVRTP